MSGSYEAIRKALATYIRDNWTSRTPVAWPNESFTPSAGIAWVRFTVLFSEAGRALITGSRDKGTMIRGLVVLQVFTPSGAGDSEISSLLDAASDLFKERRVEVSQGKAPLITKVPEPQIVGDSSGWFQVNLTTPFEFLET
ncbi:DUF4128 domain-containing protein [bacterium]|nr:DUF4128 domain-containing protein [bacterium]